MGSQQAAISAPRSARQRLLDAAYVLFSERGIRDVGVDEVLERADAAKASLYKHFGSKNGLVLAFLTERETRWTLGWVKAETESRGQTPEERLLAIFDLFDEWFRADDFEGCSFINVLLELGPKHPAGQASIGHLEAIRGVIISRAREAGLRDPEEFARSWHILMKGSIVSAREGDLDAALRAKAMARNLIEGFRA